MASSFDSRLRGVIADKAHVGVLVFDAGKKVVYCNDKMESHTGYAKEDILSTRFFELVLEDEKYIDLARNRLDSLARRSFDDLELPVVKKGGESAVLHVTGSAFDESGETYSLLIVSDITRKREYDKVLEAVYDGLMQSTIDLDAELKRALDQKRLLEDYKEAAEQILVEHENEIASAVDIQRRLLPPVLPKIRNAEIEVLYEPVRKVGGDYYDVIPLSEGRTGIVISDVTGIGIPAAFVMIMIRCIVRLCASSGSDVDALLSMVNKGVIGEIDVEHFATMSILVYDPVNCEISYSNAGHNPLLVYRKETGRFESVDTEGLPIGVVDSAGYARSRFSVSKGDIIALFTNGVIQAVNNKNQLYTLDRLLKCIEANASSGLKETMTRINRDIRSFTGDARQHSDKTMVLLRIREDADGSSGDVEEIEAYTDSGLRDVYRSLVEDILRYRNASKPDDRA